ncbi:hypothetical protein TcasGA2_TC034290 [Tribolium castaneum]|uniref:Uncharacterized protein n=1 Tax=Tribolium castaneum TaxID=7070 RepID=A0A139WCG7_TRICA|nr:hypothetical protein TcasGA2_TC034290 [Tribolium castaneum]
MEKWRTFSNYGDDSTLERASTMKFPADQSNHGCTSFSTVCGYAAAVF